MQMHVEAVQACLWWARARHHKETFAPFLACLCAATVFTMYKIYVIADTALLGCRHHSRTDTLKSCTQRKQKKGKPQHIECGGGQALKDGTNASASANSSLRNCPAETRHYPSEEKH